MIELKKREKWIFWTIEQNNYFLWFTWLRFRMRITQRCLLSQKRHHNTRRSKRLPRPPLRWHNYGSKPNKKKRTTRRLKPSLPQSIKRLLQKAKQENVLLNNLLENRLAVRRPMREPPPFNFLKNKLLRCWWYMLAIVNKKATDQILTGSVDREKTLNSI